MLIYAQFIKYNFKALCLGKKNMKRCLQQSQHLSRPPLECCAEQLKKGWWPYKGHTAVGTPLILTSLTKQQSKSYCWQVLTAHVNLRVHWTLWKPHWLVLDVLRTLPYTPWTLTPGDVQGGWADGWNSLHSHISLTIQSRNLLLHQKLHLGKI